MKVAKFGGSSLASTKQLKKVLDIVKSDSKRKFIVVSAPGKRSGKDVKVTDSLIAYYNAYRKGEDYDYVQKLIIKRYEDMASELGLNTPVMFDIAQNIRDLATQPIENNRHLYDTFLAAGENNNAKLIAAYFQAEGLEAQYLHPKDAGIIVSDEPGNARILQEAYDQINYLNHIEGIVVIPGFFGVTKEGNICTFSRGGSDITGSIVAAGVKASLYENFTDVDGIFAAHPGIVDNPHSISELTYREMRELAYSGFSVLHDEALIPAYRAQVPVVIKNTNNPSHPGTKINLKHTEKVGAVVGIASDDGFASINITKYLMNREIGFGRKILSELEKLGIRFEHMPSGIDDLSVVVRERELSPEIESTLIERLTAILDPDDIHIEHGLSIIMIVGEGMKRHIGVTAVGTTALSKKGINLEIINQGSSEVSVMFGIKKENEHDAVEALYDAYYRS
ncbi:MULTISPECIES: aspartate kinase [unclassified Enterococcus]|uniref:aspartate kinase n=1 Tax=unclassified Enterococcus TaxID=2608891 RepID=UPI001554FA3F|nr:MULTISPECIES: aspartate kinase [unclassified Enterococcus]MBS7578131.1 aspartate kinase [Enterococcus sp. MMGLQ5-2]MBS7585391.1 aspartate kinase [Enterococcus sp. MMGLQ5-1]NPD13248.1 aspartate kinase [Enterococcus sp. MMGLQ5-1]NPD37962.1 aspartate kinase [Enterococcus sp. MMGLQ5-2]